MKTEINLLKNELKDRGSAVSLGGGGEKKLTSLYIVIALLVLEALGYGALLYYKKTISDKAKAVEIETANLDLEMRSTDQALGEVLGYQLRLGNLETLLDKHLFWSPVFDELARYTYIPISYDGFQGDAENFRIVVTGIAPTYTDMAKLVLGLKSSDKFKDIALQSGGASTGDVTGYGFTLDITFDPILLKK